MPKLLQRLTLFDLTMIAIGSTIGSGIFLTPSLVARSLEHPTLIFAAWILGGVMALSGALTFAELGSMMPGAGGMYIFLREAYGGLAGFLFGWAYLLVVNTGGIAALSVAGATYLGYLVPLPSWGIPAVAVAAIICFTVINVTGVKPGGVFADIFTILKLAAIAAVILLGFVFGSRGHLQFTGVSPAETLALGGSMAAAMVGVLWSFGGWQHATFTSAEAINPQRTVPLAMIIGALVVTLLYLLINAAYFFLLSPMEIAGSQRVAADAVGRVLGAAGGAAVACAIVVSTAGTAGIYTLTAPRIYYAMASDGVFFRSLAAVHERYHTPVNAIVTQSVWAILLVCFWGTFENLISYVVFTDWIFFGLTAAAVFLFRARRPAAERPYRTIGYPVTPAIFVIAAAWFVVNTLVDRPDEAWAGIGFLAAGVPVYYFWRRRNRGVPATAQE